MANKEKIKRDRPKTEENGDWSQAAPIEKIKDDDNDSEM